MTKYILNSGSVSRYPQKYKAYVEEIVKDLGNNPKILLCFFAQKREDWKLAFVAKVASLKELMPDSVKAEFTLAMPENFARQIKNNDAIIIHGGDDHLVRYWLEQYDLQELFEDKVVAGSSAGANVLIKYFWTCDWRQNMQGLGLVPIKFLAHYQSDYGADDPRGPVAWEKAYQELKNYKEELPVHALEEGDYVVMYS